MKKLIEKMEHFLTLIQISDINLDDDVIKYLEENEKDWLQSFYHTDDLVEIWCVVFFNEAVF